MTNEIKKRILVVDDEEVILFSYKKIYQRHSLEVDVCKTPEDAIEMIRNHTYSAVISDIRFSDSESREGLEILQNVKKLSPTTPVILMTGHGNTELEEKAMELGADFYFDKPVAISTIDDTLRALGVIGSES